MFFDQPLLPRAFDELGEDAIIFSLGIDIQPIQLWIANQKRVRRAADRGAVQNLICKKYMRSIISIPIRGRPPRAYSHCGRPVFRAFSQLPPQNRKSTGTSG